MYHFFDCTVSRIIDATDHVKRFFIRKPDGDSFNFKAGQFVMLNLPIDSRITNRSYSIASPPSLDGEIELVISVNPTGKGTQYLFNEVKEGTVLKVSKPLGKFLLPDIIEHDVCFLCTGTGIAPLRSQLLDLFDRKLVHRKLYLIFGGRWEKDILYRDEMEKLAAGHPEFTYVPVLSRDNPGWNGRTGYIHPVYEELFAGNTSVLFFLCGWAEMLKEARHRLEAMGVDRKHIRFETYD